MNLETLLPPAEWNRTERTYPPALLHQVFEAQVAQTPAAAALRFRDKTLTYTDLNLRTGALAAHLSALGAEPGSLVAVCMDRSVEMVVALYAILKAGCAYVPIDPEYPAERMGFMLEDLEGPIVLTQRHLADRFVGTTARVITIDEALPETRTQLGSKDPLPMVSPDDLAYVIYTSGSTGRPKGAMITHEAIANRIYWMQEYFGLTPEDKVLQKTPFSFDVSVWEFFWPLLFGAELVIAEPGGHRDSRYLAQTIIEHGITTIHFVPSMLQLFLEDPKARECTSLRRVICSGEALSRVLQDRFYAQFDCELHNLYGPTEAAVDVTAWKCDPASPLSFVPIGEPVANTQMHILDDAMQPIPVGSVGELYIGGVQVGRGYLNRPELTAERFITDPFRPGGTLYKTGDLARYQPDGSIEFLGRADFQVKIRGFRVELGEIEAALEALDGVRAAVVVAVERTSGDLELVAYVAHPDGDALPVDDLRRRLAAQLPEYMVPTTFIAVERFPLTTSGKVDRKALPAPVRTRPELDGPYAAPRSALERLIAAKWCQLLDLDRVGIYDRFFELGGTSLAAARFVNQIQTELGESIFVVSLFGAPSVAEYATYLEREFSDGVKRLVGAPDGAPGAATGGSPIAGVNGASTADPGAREGRRGPLSQQRDRRLAARSRNSS